jgi:ubiquinone/menaquinone biosynthesis C-methylase UbiE
MDDTDYAFGRTQGEYERLIEQGELFRPLTERMLLAAGIKRGMHVLDVGCGVGDVSFLLAGMVGIEGSIIGVDLDGEAIKVAEDRRVAQGLENVAFRQSDARFLGPGQLFDAAVGRFVLMFMDDATAALRLIVERIRPGGIVAFHEVDPRMTVAPDKTYPVLAWFQSLIARTFERSGARLEAGAELYQRMLDAGLEPDPRPVAEIPVVMSDGELAYRRWALFARSMLPKMVAYGFVTEKALLDIVEHQLREELFSARGLIPLNWLMIGLWARKPLRGPARSAR